MITTQVQSIEIRRVIPATAAEVFEAWIDPEMLARWFAPGDLVASVQRLEPEVGGCFQIKMRDDAQDQTHVVGGAFVEIDPPRRIKMTWLWQGDTEPPSLVTVDFVAGGETTEVVIRHDQLPAESAAQHAEGWNACLDKLEKSVPTQ